MLLVVLIAWLGTTVTTGSVYIVVSPTSVSTYGPPMGNGGRKMGFVGLVTPGAMVLNVTRKPPEPGMPLYTCGSVVSALGPTYTR
jgi:hypothetical protein